MKEFNEKIKIFDREQYDNDKAAQDFIKYLYSQIEHRDQCVCYYNEPNFYSGISPSFTIFDREYGVIAIKLFDYADKNLIYIGENYWKFGSKKSPNLIKEFQDYCHELRSAIEKPSNEITSKINITTIAVFPFNDRSDISIELSEQIGREILFNDYRAYKIFTNIQANKITESDWEKIFSIVHQSDILSKDRGITLDEPAANLREAIFLNNQRIHRLDDTQIDAGWTITNESERIRGLAGTGKTVILAIKAARLHKKYPNAKIAYVFYTHSLYNQTKSLISEYYNRITKAEPNWENLHVLHAWGGKTTGTGFYYNICLNNGITPYSFQDVRGFKDPFAEVCKKLLEAKLLEEYDFVLIDEAQDMPREFFALVERVTKKPKRIIVAYDELQSTSDTKMPEFKELFGEDEKGNPKVELKLENDHILKKSYRNHRKVLMVAFAFGFGLYSEFGITQIIKDIDNWEALGFKVKDEKLNYGETVEIIRPDENSPNNIDKYYSDIEIINLNTFNLVREEIDYVCETIVKLINEQQVDPNQIMVIDMNKNPANNLQILKACLDEIGIESKIPGVTDNARAFMEEGYVTLTTPRRAKGNEVPIVFVMGADRIYSYGNELDQRIQRNMLFISITRSKGWVFLSGSGSFTTFLEEEYEKIIDKIPKYEFPFPTEEGLKKLANIDYFAQNQKGSQKIIEIAGNIEDLVKSGDLDKLKVILGEDILQKLTELKKK